MSSRDFAGQEGVGFCAEEPGVLKLAVLRPSVAIASQESAFPTHAAAIAQGMIDKTLLFDIELMRMN